MAATVMAPATAMVTLEVGRGCVGGQFGFPLASSADGDAVEDQAGRSSHRAGCSWSIWCNTCVRAVKPSLRYSRGAKRNRRSGTVRDVSACGWNVAAGTIGSYRVSGSAVRKSHELPSVHSSSFETGRLRAPPHAQRSLHFPQHAQMEPARAGGHDFEFWPDFPFLSGLLHAGRKFDGSL